MRCQHTLCCPCSGATLHAVQCLRKQWYPQHFMQHTALQQVRGATKPAASTLHAGLLATDDGMACRTSHHYGSRRKQHLRVGCCHSPPVISKVPLRKSAPAAYLATLCWVVAGYSCCCYKCNVCCEATDPHAMALPTPPVGFAGAIT